MNTSDNEDEVNVIDFEKKKSTFVLQRKEQKLKTLQKAFKKALPLKKAKMTKKRNNKD